MPYLNPSAWQQQQKQQQPGQVPGMAAPQDQAAPSLGSAGALPSANVGAGGVAQATPGSGASNFPAIQAYLGANQGQGTAMAQQLGNQVQGDVRKAQGSATQDLGQWKDANADAAAQWKEAQAAPYQSYLQTEDAARNAAAQQAQQAWASANPYPTGPSTYASANPLPPPGSGALGGPTAGSGVQGGGAPTPTQQGSLAQQQAAWNTADQNAWNQAYNAFTAPAYTPTTAAPVATQYAPSTQTDTLTQQAQQDLAGLNTPQGAATLIGQGYGGGWYAPGEANLDAAIAGPALASQYGNLSNQYSNILSALQNPTQPTSPAAGAFAPESPTNQAKKRQAG